MKHLLSLALVVLACGSADGRSLDAFPMDDPSIAVEQAMDAAAARDDAVREAREAMAQGRPFAATRLLGPALADSVRRTAAVELLAARAAAAWGGWSELRSALSTARWLDTGFNGEGHELLARAALGATDDSLAVTHARRAAELASGDSTRGVRLTLLARALDRLDSFQASAAAYERAAELLPPAGDWLHLRAAGVAADSAQRARLYATLGGELSRNRAGTSEAQARMRQGDTLGAARVYEANGDTVTALGLRLAVAGDAERARLRPVLMTQLRDGTSPAQASAAAVLVDTGYADLTPAERLLVARTFARSGPAARTVSAYDRAFAAGAGEVSDRIAYANALFAVRNYPLAARMYAQVPASHSRRGDAMYDQARSELRAGRLGDSRATLRRILAERPQDTTAAAQALYLLADLATDEGRDAAARSAYLDLVRRYPTSRLAPTAGFFAGLIAYVDGNHATAARELDDIARRWPASGELSRIRYWAGRAHQSAGNMDAARAHWRAVATADPRSYYAMRSRERLGDTRWHPPAGGSAVPSIPDVDSARRRIVMLDMLGMNVEARLEANALASSANSSLARAIAVGHTLLELGRPAAAIQVGLRTLGAGGDTSLAVFQLLYPVVHRDVLGAESSRRGLDPALVAGLIRQESNFEPAATSPAGARGLMQLMPATGQQVARGLGYPVWDVALLYQPDVSVELGTTHLATLVRQRDRVEHVLAAYNAGSTPVARWLRKRGADDPEVFTERISYAESRDYVRVVLRNREMYGAIYGWQ